MRQTDRQTETETGRWGGAERREGKKKTTTKKKTCTQKSRKIEKKFGGNSITQTQVPKIYRAETGP